MERPVFVPVESTKHSVHIAAMGKQLQWDTNGQVHDHKPKKEAS